MRRTARFLTLATALVVVAPSAPAHADGARTTGASAGGTVMAFSQVSRRCDFSETDYNGPTGDGRPIGTIYSDGSTITADVEILTAKPNMRYDVRLIQLPRSSAAPCWGGDPGVAQGEVFTDPAGAARITLSDAIEPWATGAWIWITRPDAFSQNPAEFYTTDFVAQI